MPLEPGSTAPADTSSIERRTIKWSYLSQQFAPHKIDEILQLFREFVPSGDFTLGKPLREFEARFAALIGARHALGVGSGTDALKLSLKALGVGHGDEVITTANTFIATVGAIAEIGAVPVFVDCTENLCMDVSQVEAAITPRTRAIMPVHYAGQMTDMRALMALAGKHGIPVVEDACQCILGSIEGRNAGTWGNAGGFSLHPLKNLNVWGDGGMIVTDDDALADTLGKLRNHGLASRDEVVMMGYNSRLDTLQAVVGSWLIDEVPAITDARIRAAARLDAGLSAIRQIKLPPRYSDRRLVYHLYIVYAEDRDGLYAWCSERGIPVKVHYPVPVYLQPGVRAIRPAQEGDFPVTDRLARTMISFPAHDYITDDEIDYMVATVRAYYER